MPSQARAFVRPKRTADTFARTHNAEEPGAKRLRFDVRNPSQLIADAEDEEEQGILEIDEVGKSAGTKRSAVNLDGYESDSDDDNFDARAVNATRKQKEAADGQQSQKVKSPDEDDDDMFADLAEDGDGKAEDDYAQANPETHKKDRRSVKFLDDGDIQGQNFKSKPGANVFDVTDASGKTVDIEDDAGSDSESGGDEGRDYVDSDDDDAQEVGAGGKKKHAPRLDAFNMREEAEEGKFDESGNFIRRADPNAIHDHWMQGVSKKDMKRARQAEQSREQQRKERDARRDALLTSDLLSTLIGHLQIGESVLEALARLAKTASRSRLNTKPKWQRHQRQADKMHLDQDQDLDNPSIHQHDNAEMKRKADVETITEAADTLLTRGDEEIYHSERELLMRKYKRDTGHDWTGETEAATSRLPDPNNDEQAEWQFRWTDARDGGELHGPYDTATMQAWNLAGYFAQGAEFNKAGSQLWSHAAEFLS